MGISACPGSGGAHSLDVVNEHGPDLLPFIQIHEDFTHVLHSSFYTLSGSGPSVPEFFLSGLQFGDVTAL